MQKKIILRGIIPLVGILLLMLMAYWHSMQAEKIYDERMHRDIQGFVSELTQAGMPQTQVKVFSSALLGMNRNMLNYVYSEVSSLVSTFATMGIIIMVFSLALIGQLAQQKDKDG
jgi:hypothetical protein